MPNPLAIVGLDVVTTGHVVIAVSDAWILGALRLLGVWLIWVMSAFPM